MDEKKGRRIVIDLYIRGAAPSRPLQLGEAANHEGGIVYALDAMARLRRFLILGAEGGTYYANASDHAVENVGAVIDAIKENGPLAVHEIVNISTSGRAPKNEPAILALAIASVRGDDETRRLAFSSLNQVCRIGTHLLHFVAYREGLGGGWGRGMRRAIAAWFLEKNPRDVAYQATKYAQRDKWALADLLKLSHLALDYGDRVVVPPTHESLGKISLDHAAVFQYMLHGWSGLERFSAHVPGDTPVPKFVNYLSAVEYAKGNYDGDEVPVSEVAEIIRSHKLPREVVATNLLAGHYAPVIWDALLQDMPATALLRTLNRLTASGVVSAGSDGEKKVIEKLRNTEFLRRSRVHPIGILIAAKVYGFGRGIRGGMMWNPSRSVINALDEAFYASFESVPPTGKAILYALDVSASMKNTPVVGTPALNCREAAAAMALVAASVEPNIGFVAYSDDIVPLKITQGMRIDEVMRVMENTQMGGTICSLPIDRAARDRQYVDAFVSFTDNETFNGRASPYGLSWMFHSGYWKNRTPKGFDLNTTVDEALQRYRGVMGHSAMHAVVALASNGFSIANPKDPYQMDFCGLDSSLPALLSDFIGGAM